jgi:GTPase SAR1 family protein
MSQIKDTMSEWIEAQVQDTVVQSVINKFKQRSEVGIKKYGVTLERTDLTTLNWIEEAQAEAMDFCLYLERLKRQFNEK